MAKRCLGCMKMKTQSPVCEHCGYNENIPNYPHQLPLGTVLRGQYQIGKVLGQGGFGITYMGWDLNLDVPIAVKEYFPNGFVNRECTHSLSVTCSDENRSLFYHNRERFIREAKALAKLRDVPGIVRIHNFFQENDTAYIVMEYVEGIDLKRYIRLRNRTMSAGEILTVLRPVMEAMSKVHEAGLVHRDITPDNIMILPDGSAKLLDFGAVREVVDPDADKNLSQATEAILKQGFAPMEQYQNRGSLGPWTDVYALCATIYYCVTGRVPPDAPARLLESKPLDWNAVPGLTPQQAAALDHGMAVMPKQRTASIAELYNELYSPAQPQPVPQNIPNSAVQPQSRVQSSVDFRNAYQNSGYQNAVPNPAPDPISNTGRNPYGAANYPNHTVPLEGNPINGYQYVPPVQPVQPVTPVTPIPPVNPAPAKKKSKLPLILGIAAAAVAAVVAISGLSGGSAPKNNDEPKKKLAQASESLDTVMADGPDHTYDYRDGSLLELYFDNNELERCRMYYNNKGDLEYKFVAEYNEYGDILNHWVYDGNDNLIRQDTKTYDKEGNILSHQLTSTLGTVLETTEYTYEHGNLTSYITKDGQGNVKEEKAYGYDDEGKQISSLTIYADGSSTELTFNEFEKTEFQYNYDENGDLERWYEYEYDADGERTSTLNYKADGTLETTSKPVYNPDGNLVKDTWYKADGTVSYTMTYQYLAGEIMIGNNYETDQYTSESESVRDIMGTYVLYFDYAVSSYSDPPSVTNSITTYNNFGDSVERISYNEDGSVSNSSEYRYDDFGNSLGYTYTYYSSDGSYSVTEYNKDSNADTRTSYDASGNLESWTEYEYDAEGLEAKQVTYKADGSISYETELTYENGEVYRRTTTYYNEDGTYSISISDADYNTLTRTSYDKNGNVTYLSRYEYEWNEFGKPAKAYIYDKNGNLSYWTEYFYDENGNYKDLETHFD